MGTLLWVLVGLLVVLLIAVALPWHVRLTGRTDPPQLRADLRLLGGRAPAIPLRRGGGRKDKPARKRKPKHRRRKSAAAQWRSLTGIGPLIRGILAAFGLRRAHLEGRFGLDDPADTGALYGVAMPIVQLARAAGARIDLSPEFGGRCLDLSGGGDFIFRPVPLLGALIRFAWVNRRSLMS